MLDPILEGHQTNRNNSFVEKSSFVSFSTNDNGLQRKNLYRQYQDSGDHAATYILYLFKLYFREGV